MRHRRHRAANDNARYDAPIQLTLYTRAHVAVFDEWLEQNPLVWELFERFTFEAIAAGMRRYSADAICHRIRWHVEIETCDRDGFKLNNNHVAYLARLFAKKNPKHADFFRLRAQRRTA